MKVASGAWRRVASSRLSVPFAFTAKSRMGSPAAQSCDGCAAAWMTSSMRPHSSRKAASTASESRMSVSTTRMSGYSASRRSTCGRVDAEGPKNLARMSFSIPSTSKPDSAKNAADSEPTRPPAPVTIAVPTRSAYATAEERPHDSQPVERGQLLPLLAAAGAVGDRHLVDPDASREQPRGDLGLDREAALAETERAEELGPHRLVPRHQVGDPAVVDDVREERDGAVADDIPEAVRRVRLEAANAEDGVGDAVAQRPEQHRQIVGRVLEVGVQDGRVCPARLGERCGEGGALAPVPWVEEHADVLRPVVCAKQLRAAVDRAVVDDDQLEGVGDAGVEQL